MTSFNAARKPDDPDQLHLWQQLGRAVYQFEKAEAALESARQLMHQVRQEYWEYIAAKEETRAEKSDVDTSASVLPADDPA